MLRKLFKPKYVSSDFCRIHQNNILNRVYSQTISEPSIKLMEIKLSRHQKLTYSSINSTFIFASLQFLVSIVNLI